MLDILANSYLMGGRQSLNIIATGSVETQRLSHRLVIKSVQGNSLCCVSLMPVLTLGRNAKGVALPQLKLLSFNLTVSTALDDVIH